LTINGEFNSYIAIEKNENNFAFIFKHNTKKNMNNKTISFEKYWVSMKQYNQKLNNNYNNIRKNNKKKLNVIMK